MSEIEEAARRLAYELSGAPLGPKVRADLALVVEAAIMAEHNRYAPNCERFPTKVGPDTQYLIDWHRGETCPACEDQA